MISNHNALYYFAFILWTIETFIGVFTKFYLVGDFFEQQKMFIQVCVICMLVLKLFLDSYSWYILVFFTIVLTIFAFVSIISNNKTILNLLIFSFACKNVELKKLAYLCFWIVLSLSMIVFLLFIFDFIKDETVYRGFFLRRSLGLGHPNRLGEVVFILFFSFILMLSDLNRKIIIVSSFISIIIGCIVYSITDCRTFILCIFLFWVWKFCISFRLFSRCNKFINKCLLIFFLIIMFVLFYLVVNIEVPSSQLVNTLLSGRISSSNYYLNAIGWSFWGKTFSVDDFNVPFDMCYVYLLLKYGIFGTTIFLLLLIRGMYANLDQQYLFVISLLILFYGFFERSLFDITMSYPFIFLLNPFFNEWVKNNMSGEFVHNRRMVQILCK